jgi:hypothetical protein
VTPAVYIISRGRATLTHHTSHYLSGIGVPHRIVIEYDEYDDYARVFGAERLLVMDPSYKELYNFHDSQPSHQASGPARNFVWDHAAEHAHSWHWVFDDNIRALQRRYRNGDRPATGREWFDPFHTLIEKVKNVGMTGPIYSMFRPPYSGEISPMAISHLMSALLIRTDLPLRWECRYNEDIDLSIRAAESGWLPLRLNVMLIKKTPTQQDPGGNTSVLYSHGTAAKTSQLVARHPKYVKAVQRYGRPHHTVDWPRIIKDHRLQIIV